MGLALSLHGLSKLLRFSILHSLRDMWRNRARTSFALVCVATGVAAVVALRSLAFMVGDELTTNLAQINRGDIRVYASRGVPELVELNRQRNPVFTQETVDWIRQWAVSERVEVTFARLGGFAQITPLASRKALTSQMAQVLYIEPDKYPYYDTIVLREPAGVTLEALFMDRPAQGDTPAVVISNNLARHAGLGLQLGDKLRIGASETVFEVRGIAPSTAETILSIPSAAFLGNYLYAPFDNLSLLGEQPLPDQVFIRVPLGRDIQEVEAGLIDFLQDRANTDTDFKKELNRASVPELEKQNAETADVIDDMILVMSLSSLLIGGIGIINTMLVVVSRRTLEIAVLKTLGLKGYRVTVLFLVEALLMGLAGSLIGIAAGVLLSYVIRGVGEEAFALSLEWRLYPEAMLSGLFLGIVITGLFGFLPTLIAGQVRPAVVLRPNEAQMPAAGLIQTMLALIAMIVILGLLVSAIVEGAFTYGPPVMIAGGGALVGLFAGVIIANTRLGQPIPEHYLFRLSRRYERLERRLLWSTGRLSSWLPVRNWSGRSSEERGRAVVTRGLRGLRQAVLLYGAAAVGAALASVVVLLLSELWLPFGLGKAEPANEVVGAWQRGDTGWVIAWAALALFLGYLVRRYARGLVGTIALGSLGISLGGMVGWFVGSGLRQLLGETDIWNTLEDMSTGIVLVEGALAILAVVYVGYWLMVWAVSKLPTGALMAVISLTMFGLIAGGAAAASLAGAGALASMVAVVVAIGLWYQWRAFRDRWRSAQRRQQDGSPGHAIPSIRVSNMPYQTLHATRFPSLLTLSAIVVSGGMLLANAGAANLVRALVVLAGAIILFGLWRYLQQHYAVDGRLVLRAMNGRRARVASTLLGLSVGIAGLSVVSLTTSAVSRLLEFQLGETAEGNLLIGDPTSQHGEEIIEILSQAEGVESFSQVVTYSAVLVKVNGEQVEPFHRRSVSEEEDPRENSSAEMLETGVPIGLTARAHLDDLPDYRMKSGRPLQPGDEGQHRIMLRESFVTEELGIETGDRLMFLFRNGLGDEDDVLLQVVVVGIISRKSEQSGLEELGHLSILPPGLLNSDVRAEGIATIVQVDESDDVYMDRVLVAVADVPGVIAFELSALTQLAENLLNQLKAIPTLVAWLAVVAGTAIIANTVALATQERRREIGVMKTVGLKGRRVLAMLMLENGLIGLIAGLIGVGVGFVFTVVLVLVSQDPQDLKRMIDVSTMGWLILMSIVVAMGAAALSAWSAAAEKPMNVLRYD